MTGAEHLRPLERRILRLHQSGIEPTEIARVFRRSPGHIERVIALTKLPGREGAGPATGRALRPLERRVLRWLDQGVDHERIAVMFRRSPDHIRRVAGMAFYKKAVLLLSGA